MTFERYKAYMAAGYVPQLGAKLPAATEYVQHVYREFTITFKDDRFYADNMGTPYYWENDILFRRKDNK